MGGSCTPFISNTNCHVQFCDLHANLNRQDTGAANLAAFPPKSQMAQCHLLGTALTFLVPSASPQSSDFYNKAVLLISRSGEKEGPSCSGRRQRVLPGLWF